MAEELGITTPLESGVGDAQQKKMDLLLGYLLLSGVAASMVLIVAGTVWNFIRTGHFWLNHRLAEMNFFEFVVREIRSAAQHELRPRTLVNLGIAVLMFTPYLRVVASMAYFMAVLKNWKYSLFTGVVLAVLTFSLFLR